MPAKSPSPVVIKSTTVDADIWRCSGIFIGLPNSGKSNTIDLIISIGQSQADGSIVWIEDKRYRVEDEPDVLDENGNVVTAGNKYFSDLIASATNGGSIYDELKTLVYDYAKTRGWIPADAVQS